MIALLLPHAGGHCAPSAPLLACVPLFFRRALRLPWRKPAALGPVAGRGGIPADATPRAATVLLGEPARFPCCSHCWESGELCVPPDSHLTPCGGCNDVLGNRMIADVRAEYGGLTTAQQAEHAGLMHAGYASAVDRLRREAGLPTVAEMHAMRAGSPHWAFPPLNPPAWAEPAPRGPVHDTRMDVLAPHYAPDAGAPVEYSTSREVVAAALDGLRNLDRHAPTEPVPVVPVYGQAPVAAVLEAERLSRVMQP